MDFNKIERIFPSESSAIRETPSKNQALTPKGNEEQPLPPLPVDVASITEEKMTATQFYKLISDSALFHASDELILRAVEIAFRNATDTVMALLKRLHKEFSGVNDEEKLYLFELLMKLETQFTYEHSCRVTHFSQELAKELNCSDKQMEDIKDGAKFKDLGKAAVSLTMSTRKEQDALEELLGEQLHSLRESGSLHDIGKIKIPLEILNKPDRLTDTEFEIMKQHPIIGAQLLRPLSSMKDVIPVVLNHHERWDGKGYPYGTKATSIPLSARIVAVADSYDAMTSDRPYRKALPVQKAREELLTCAGSQFDPVVAAAFVKMIDKGLVE